MKVMKSWKSHLFRKRPPSQIFDWTLKTPLVYTLISKKFSIQFTLRQGRKQDFKILWWCCTRFYEIVYHASICITYLVLYIIRRIYLFYSKTLLNITIEHAQLRKSQNFNRKKLKLVSATFYQIFIFSSDGRPSTTMANVFYFI